MWKSVDRQMTSEPIVYLFGKGKTFRSYVEVLSASTAVAATVSTARYNPVVMVSE